MLLSQIHSSMEVNAPAEAERIVSESDLAQLKACVRLLKRYCCNRSIASARSDAVATTSLARW